MNDLSGLFLLLALVAGIGLWLKLSAGRERAVRLARQQCQLHGLQLLDETVGLRSVRLRRFNGIRRIERGYAFEVSIDGADRQHARLWMVADALTSVSLPSITSLAHDNDITPLRKLDPSGSGNVVPFRPRARSNAAAEDELY